MVMERIGLFACLTREAFEKGFLERSRNIVAVVGPESDHAAQEENSVAVEEALRV